MIHAISRASVDIKPKEVLAILFELLRPHSASNEEWILRFEQSFARYIGIKDAVSFSSGRAAAYFGLKALNLTDGDEVILPAFTFCADAAMVVLAGLKPVFIDVDPSSANIDPDQIEAKITPRTKVLFLTHLNGLPVDMARIGEIAQRHGLRVIEDCARACGVKRNNQRLGAFDIGIFSFGYGKNFFLFGGGGMLTSNDDALINQLRTIKKNFLPLTKSILLQKLIKGLILKTVNHPFIFRFSLFPLLKAYHIRKSKKAANLLRPKISSYKTVPVSFSRPLGSIQAKQGLDGLARIDRRNKKIEQNARSLRRALAGSPGLHVFRSPQMPSNEMLYFSLGCERKEEIKSYLFHRKIEVEEESASNLTHHGLFKTYAQGSSYPNAARLAGRMIFLPSHPGLSQKDLGYIIKHVSGFTQAS